MRIHRSMLLAAVLVGLLALSGTAAASSITIGMPGEATGFDPRTEVDVDSVSRYLTILEPLVVYDLDLELEARLATDWHYDPDELTLTFWLREGVPWHHGREFTAVDVEYTIATVLDPEVGAQDRALYQDIEEIEVVDDYTITFHLSSANPFLVNNMARMPIIPHDVVEEDPDMFNISPIGTGPFEFSSWRRDDEMVFTAFADYWGGEPKLDEIIFRPIPESSTRALALEGGEVDIVTRVSAMDYWSFEDDPSIQAFALPAPGYDYIGFNTKVGPLADKRVRQAVSYLVDREAIVDQLLEGLGEPGVANIPPTLPWFHDELEGYDYNPEKARELLTEAGYGPDGETLEMSLYTREGIEVRMQVAEIMSYLLGQEGIQLDIVFEEWGAFLDRILDSDDYDMFILGWAGQLDPDRASYRQFHTEGGSNFTYYSNPELDELLEYARTLPADSEESLAAYREVQEIVLEDAPYAFLFYEYDNAAAQEHVKGWEMHPYVAQNFLNIHEAYIED